MPGFGTREKEREREILRFLGRTRKKTAAQSSVVNKALAGGRERQREREKRRSLNYFCSLIGASVLETSEAHRYRHGLMNSEGSAYADELHSRIFGTRELVNIIHPEYDRST